MHTVFFAVTPQKEDSEPPNHENITNVRKFKEPKNANGNGRRNKTHKLFDKKRKKERKEQLNLKRKFQVPDSVC